MGRKNNLSIIKGILGNVGPTGIAVGMICGLFVSLVFHLWAKLKFLENSSVPDFVVSWINVIIPNVIVLGITMVLVFNLGISVFDIIIGIFMPLAKVAQTLPGFILISLLYAFFYTLGLNVLMCFSKSTQLKMLGRVFIVPSIFNINEPLMFGAPVVFNPLLMLPVWNNAILGPAYVWILMSTGLLKIPSMKSEAKRS